MAGVSLDNMALDEPSLARGCLRLWLFIVMDRGLVDTVAAALHRCHKVTGRQTTLHRTTVWRTLQQMVEDGVVAKTGKYYQVIHRNPFLNPGLDAHLAQRKTSK